MSSVRLCVNPQARNRLYANVIYEWRTFMRKYFDYQISREVKIWQLLMQQEWS